MATRRHVPNGRSRRRMPGMETLVLLGLIALATVIVTACVRAFG